MDSLQWVMSQIASVRWQESEKLRDASNFTIWASVLHLKAAQYGGVVQGYIKSGALLCADIEAEKVKVALDTICHTLVTGGLFPEVLEEVLYNGWYGREVIVQLDKLYGSIGVEAAIMLVRSLTSGDCRKLISSKRDYNKFFNEFLSNVLKAYTPYQLAALFMLLQSWIITTGKGFSIILLFQQRLLLLMLKCWLIILVMINLVVVNLLLL